jgi:hypothetical protein
MTKIPYSDETIHERATPQSYSRGEDLYERDAVFDTVKRGDTLEAWVEASSQPDPYFVRIELGKKGIESAACTCEYAYGGDCKHIVAVLHAYLFASQTFVEKPTIESLLEDRDRDQLLALIKQMVAAYPDLQNLVERPIPGRTTRASPVDTTNMRQQLRRILRTYHEWGDHSVEQTVYSLAQHGHSFADANDWQNAANIYIAIIEECTTDGYPMSDDEGEFVTALDSVVTDLAQALEQPGIVDNDALRVQVLNTLLRAFIWDVDEGGIGVGDEVSDWLVTYARQPDIAGLRNQIVAAEQRKAQSPYGRWGMEAYEALRIQLDDMDNVDPEVVLARLRENGMYVLLINKLLLLERPQEALAVAEQHITAPSERALILPRLVSAGLGDDAVRLAQTTLQNKYDAHLLDWLLVQLKAMGDDGALMDWQFQRVKHAPTPEAYTALREVAQKHSKWDDLRKQVHNLLEQERRFDMLARIALIEEEWDAAWSWLEKTNSQAVRYVGFGMMGNELALTVAEHSAIARPERAIPVFVQHARRCIEQRNHDAYATAALYLGKAQVLYKRIGDLAMWQKLMTDIRAEYPRLRALHDELKRAGL